jgi:hypothetical protein
MFYYYSLYMHSLVTVITCKIKCTQYVMSSSVCLPHYNVYVGGNSFYLFCSLFCVYLFNVVIWKISNVYV